MWVGFRWLMVDYSHGHLWTQQWTVCFHGEKSISPSGMRLLASQKLIWHMELVISVNQMLATVEFFCYDNSIDIETDYWLPAVPQMEMTVSWPEAEGTWNSPHYFPRFRSCVILWRCEHVMNYNFHHWNGNQSFCATKYVGFSSPVVFHPCGLVVSVANYKHRGPGFDSRALRMIFLRELSLEWGPLSLVIG
jgi:hypothetical protein